MELEEALLYIHLDTSVIGYPGPECCVGCFTTPQSTPGVFSYPEVCVGHSK